MDELLTTEEVMKNPNCIHSLRVEASLSLQKLADMCGLTKAHLHQLEHGRSMPNLRTAYAVAKIFDLTVYDIWPDDTQIVEETVTVKRVVRRG